MGEIPEKTGSLWQDIKSSAEGFPTNGGDASVFVYILADSLMVVTRKKLSE